MMQYLTSFFGPFMIFTLLGWAVSFLWFTALTVGLIVGALAGVICTAIIWVANKGRRL